MIGYWHSQERKDSLQGTPSLLTPKNKPHEPRLLGTISKENTLKVFRGLKYFLKVMFHQRGRVYIESTLLVMRSEEIN